MNITEIKDTDSSDSEIFIVKQIKPINRITLQEALIIKHSVLKTAKSKKKVKNKKVKNNTNKNSNKVKKKCVSQQKDSPQKPEDRKSASKTVENDKNEMLEKMDIKLPEKLKRNSSGEIKQSVCIDVSNSKTSPTKITDYFTGQVKKKVEKNEENFETGQISPGISRRRKKFKINDDNSKSPEHKSPTTKSLVTAIDKVKKEITFEKEDTNNSANTFKDIDTSFKLEPFFEPKFQNNFTDILSSVEIQEIFENNGELSSFLLKKIICSELEKQNNPENIISENGIIPEKLFLENEEKILKKFLHLNKSSSNVLVRMLCRKKDWHRVSALNLKDIKNCSGEFDILHKENFIDIDIENQDIRTQINLLLRPEIFQLCKKFNVFLKNNLNKKQDLINSLLETSTKQKSVFDMFNKNDSNSRLNLLKSELKCCLGMCVKLSETTLSAFNKIIVLFSFAHYFDEEDKRFSNQLFMCLEVFKHKIKFPNYKLSPCVVFETRTDFEEYLKSLALQNCFEIATTNKQFSEFTDIAKKAEVEFKTLLNNEEYKVRYLRLKPFLKKFNAGTVYARILTNYCMLFKKQTNNKKIISVAKLLLDQNIFLIRKRGEWYKALANALENQREINAASEVLIKALNDPLVNEVYKLTLKLKGQLILKRKRNGIDDAELREALDYACVIEVQEPQCIEIRGQAIQGNEKGYKCVYVEQREDGKVYSSVEEKAISYYKSNGYTRGFHEEGFIMHSMYFLFFHEVIYELSPVGVFHTLYQQAPLDFYSSSFYLNRKDEIDLLFAEMLSWSDAEIEAKLNQVYHKNIGTTCLITWTEGFTPDLFCEILKCITMPLFVSICRRFVTNFAAVRAGFPDLTLWNPETKKCKFVEVKSPNDKLSPAQRIWLDFLKNLGIDCEVCNVKNINAKKLKS